LRTSLRVVEAKARNIVVVLSDPTHTIVCVIELTTSQKGAIAESAITTAVMELGLTVLRPLCEGGRYDLVIDLEPRLLRVQCKTARTDGGALLVPTKTNRLTGRGYHGTCYTSDEADALAAYCPATGCTYLLPISEVAGRSLVHLRLSAPKNNQTSGVRWARDYELATAVARLRRARPPTDP
jgi:hypothetical protein